MLSRVADSIYWLNRYIERAENIARFVDVNFSLNLDIGSNTSQQWEPLIITTGDHDLFRDRYGEATEENVLKFLTFDRNYPNSILSCLAAARENARSIREIISSEMWEQVNSFYWMVQDTSKQIDEVDLPRFFQEVKMASHLFAGVMDATLSHNEGWHFGHLGRMLERADKTARILDVKYFILLPSPQDVGTLLDELQWIALLRSASAYEMYRKQGRRRITPLGVAEFLILNPIFPRSIRHSLGRVESSLHKICGTPAGTWSNLAQRAIGRLSAELGYLTMSEIFDIGLHEFLDDLEQKMNHVDQQIFETFFTLDAIAA
ncbi:alpha-E domain-containing protein [Synechococcus elongatus]|uniref:Alpha-E domain-containing protein n=2 Tax=Synechococcus elongatus TaxID=32046 RepID=A0AAN1QPN8_SYNEL|nr:alpha-E domain-containing protein [Synechococcus elongatus]AZB73217.1 alpha-E domain-containing protein [Synechococcus elongatus PCC 11801]QFZ92372.1 alpha-E domain-containing protein [Synechococcus elongatus PCC 11802]